MKKANSIKEAIDILDEVFKNSEKSEIIYIKEMSDVKEMIQYHQSMGRHIRNEWEFWQDKPNKLKEEVIKLGSGSHPDDISMFILNIFYYHVKFPEKHIENIINEMIIKNLVE